jgi:predicted CoA-substrate-specific enzyme activase
MLGFVCKYTPVEVLTAMGADPVRIEPVVTDFNEADAYMHPNVCSYAKAVLEDFSCKPYEGVVLTTCCDSIRRLYDTLVHRYPDRFIYLLDVPRVVNDFTAGMYAERILEMAKSYAAYSGKTYREEDLKEILRRQNEAVSLKGAPVPDDAVKIGLIGARCNSAIRNLLDNLHGKLVFDLTCAGLERNFKIPEKPEIKNGTEEKAALPTDPGPVFSASPYLTAYAGAVLNQIPCMRMINAVNREHFVEGFADEIDGLIYHTVKFCDVYSYEYAGLHLEGKFPILKVETDLTAQCEGQIRTRVEAFMESLRALKGQQPDGETAAGTASAKKNFGTGERKNMYVMGIDSGSTSTNAVIMNGEKEIVASEVLRTGAKTADSAERILADTIRKAGLKREDILMIVSTGYGRVSIPFADENVTEISCHAKGARYFNPAVQTILDIGGQDSKAIRLNEAGEVADFVMNDKCAAGTGRFLEAMARTLELSISELGPESLKSKEHVEISSMCTVFAESEVISLIAQNKEKADIAAGVHRAIAGKAWSLLSRVNPEPEYMMTGGVAKNVGVVKALEEKIGAGLYISPDPEIVGAAGAALFALEKCL